MLYNVKITLLKHGGFHTEDFDEYGEQREEIRTVSGRNSKPYRIWQARLKTASTEN